MVRRIQGVFRGKFTNKNICRLQSWDIIRPSALRIVVNDPVDMRMSCMRYCGITGFQTKNNEEQCTCPIEIRYSIRNFNTFQFNVIHNTKFL